MATTNSTTITTYQCPECPGDVSAVHGSWGCTDCGYVPPHGAD